MCDVPRGCWFLLQVTFAALAAGVVVVDVKARCLAVLPLVSMSIVRLCIARLAARPAESRSAMGRARPAGRRPEGNDDFQFPYLLYWFFYGASARPRNRPEGALPCPSS